MGHWNYRVLKHSDGTVAIHEVFYGDDGKPHSCSAEPTGFVGDSLEDLQSGFELARRGLAEGVLDYESFGENTRSATKT
jgi:hypothetical protein